MVSKEAELFERANVVDIGIQRNDDWHRRPLDRTMGSLRLDDDAITDEEDSSTGDDYGAKQLLHGFVNDEDGAPEDDEDAMQSLNIDEVDQPHPLRSHVSRTSVNGSLDSNGDSNLTVDESFQRSLNERASQFVQHEGNSINTGSFPSIPKPRVDYEYSDKLDIRRSIDDWFSSKEMAELAEPRICFAAKFSSHDFNHMGIDDRESVIEQLTYELHSKDPHTAIKCILFITLGAYEEDRFIFEDHITKIQRNCHFIVQSNVIPSVLMLLDKMFEICSTTQTGLVHSSKSLFYLCTILYIVVLVYSSDGTHENDSACLSDILDEYSFLSKLMTYIDRWRWNSRSSMRIRNIVTLLSVVFTFQFGGLEKRRKIKSTLCTHLGIDTSEVDPSSSSATPMDFHAFRQEISARYPSYDPPPTGVPADVLDPSSLLQFITSNRSQTSRFKLNGTAPNPPPRVHISTPAPSPSPPSSISKQFKGKRSYQTDPNYPLIFPSETLSEDVPSSIREASELFASRVKEKLALKQLWHERDIFVKQERGWGDTMGLPDDMFDYTSIEGSGEFAILNRIETFYSENLGNLSSLVYVLMQLIATSLSSVDALLKNSLSPDEAEMIRTKEILWKHATFIILLLLKWFKISHVLKFEYLSSLVCDSNYFAVLNQYLKVLDVRVLDRMGLVTVFKYENSVWADDMPVETVDRNFCFSFINMLEISHIISHGKTQRVLTISEMDPASLYRNLVSVYNPSLWSPVLKLLKDITPFNGKKWKANNMDLISMVYLHGKSKLRDNWLSGRDVELEINDAYGQEIALRALIQFYNMRKYSKTMEKLGYQQKTHDIFAREVDLASTEI